MTSKIMHPSEHYTSPQNLSGQQFDIAFVGAGLSTAMTLVHYLSKIFGAHHESPKAVENIIVLEKSPDFFTGIPYGQRSGYNSLIINSLADFLPVGELESFRQWLIQNIETIFIPFLSEGETFSKEWYAKNYDSILRGDIGSIYLPRYIFGEYLKQKVDEVISTAERDGIAKIKCVQALVTGITASAFGSSRFVVELDRNSKPESIFSNSVVLALGSPPGNSIIDDENITECGYFNNPFTPGLGGVVSKTKKVLREQMTGNVLIAGSNASALDVIVNLTSSSEICDRLNKIFVMSPSGRLPELYLESEETNKYKTVLLDKLIKKPDATANEILELAEAEIALSRNQGYTIAMSLGPISATVFKIVQTLDIEQKMVFVHSVGNLIGKIQRRAGSDYFKVIEALVASGKLEILSGSFRSLESIEGRYDIRYVNGNESNCKLNDIAIVINCTGASTLPPETEDTFLHRLFSSGLCEVNGSQFGIKVDSDFQTKTKGMYVMGPMLAGNIIGSQMIWHLEHCRRISVEAEKLASVLIDRRSPVQ